MRTSAVKFLLPLVLLASQSAYAAAIECTFAAKKFADGSETVKMELKLDPNAKAWAVAVFDDVDQGEFREFPEANLAPIAASISKQAAAVRGEASEVKAFVASITANGLLSLSMEEFVSIDSKAKKAYHFKLTRGFLSVGSCK